MALDDLVEPLAGEAGAAVVDEEVALVAQADELRAAALEVAAGGRDGLAADRDEPLLGALAARAQHAGAQVDGADGEVDGLARAQPAGVHELEHRAVAQRGGVAAAGRREQPGDLVAAEDLRQLEVLARRAQLRRRVVGDDLLAAQVAVERAQAGGLALDRRGRDRRALRPAGGELGEKARELGVAERRRVVAVAHEEVAELQEVGAVGLERVARQPALELEVGEEVEHVVLEALRCRCCGGDGHGRVFAAAAERTFAVQRGACACSRRRPCGLSRRRRSRSQLQAEQRLGVGRGGDRAVEVVQRPADDLDPLAGVGLDVATSRRPVAAKRWTPSSL